MTIRDLRFQQQSLEFGQGSSCHGLWGRLGREQWDPAWIRFVAFEIAKMVRYEMNDKVRKAG